MKSIKEYEFWFVTGSQHLYGPETLEQVAKDSQAMVDGLNASGLDAHIQSVKDVDKRSKGLQKALLSFPYTV